MRKKDDQLFGNFARSIDQMFDEFLIDRWHGAHERFDHAEVVNHTEHYEVRLQTVGVDPAQIEVESLGQRLTVRAPVNPHRKVESSFRFAEAIDAEAASARWSNDTLIIILPKQKARRIFLKDS